MGLLLLLFGQMAAQHDAPAIELRNSYEEIFGWVQWVRVLSK